MANIFNYLCRTNIFLQNNTIIYLPFPSVTDTILWLLTNMNIVSSLYNFSRPVTLSVPVHCGDPAAAGITERTNAWAETFFLDLALRFVRSRALLERKISGLSDLRHVTWVDRC